MGNPIFFGHNTSGIAPIENDFSDDFNRANSSTPGGNWTQIAGDCDIVSNQLRTEIGGLDFSCVRYNTAVPGLTQYMKATMGGWGSSNAYLGFIFRWGATNSSPSYRVSFASIEDQVSWSRYSNTSGNNYGSDISTASITVNGGDSFGVTIDGIGSGTVIRVWRNPAGLPIAANNWNGDTSPTVSFTTNPPTPVDTGLGLGLAFYADNAGGLYVDDWFGGSL